MAKGKYYLADPMDRYVAVMNKIRYIKGTAAGGTSGIRNDWLTARMNELEDLVFYLKPEVKEF